jgi:hypothetical protein
MARDGVRAVKIRYDSKEGFDAAIKRRVGFELTDDLDGVAGANIYAHNLAIRVNKSPVLTNAILLRTSKPSEITADHIVSAIEDVPATARLMHQSGFGRFYLDDAGNQVRAVTPEEVQLGKQQWADQITNEFRYLVTGRNGVVQKKLVDYIRDNEKAPPAEWLLDNLNRLDRPQAMLRPTFLAAPSKTPLTSGVDDLMERSGKVYQRVVEQTIQRTLTAPQFTAAYATSKVALRPFKAQLIEGGLSDEAAEAATREIACTRRGAGSPAWWTTRR